MSIRRLIVRALMGNLLAGSLLAASEPLNLPISFSLERAATVTVVIEDATGKRVRNLAAAVRLPAGTNQLGWDGYDDGERQKDGSTIRHLVPPGRYQARGVTSDGLKLIYEFPVNSPGNPPWFTKERNGAWLADHTAAQSIVMVPASDQGFLGRGGPRLIVSAITAECGDAFMAIDLDGKKIIGNNDFGWTGAYAITLDRGPQRPTGESDPWLYCLIPEGDKVKLNTFTTGGKAFTVLTHKTTKEIPWNGGHTGDSVTAWNGTVVISVPHDGVLLVVDPATKSLVGTIPMPDVRGVLFDDQGHLLVATATRVKRLAIDLAKAMVTRDEPLVSTDLEDAQQITRDKAGNLYVGDWGTQHVVKVFSPTGKLVRTIGKPGGPQLGHFDPERLHYPKGLAVDERGQLWVVDADHLPKRITTWTTDGKLTRSLIGGPKYGGGGSLDPADRTRMYYGIFNGGYSLKLDWKAGTAVVDSVYSRPETDATINPDHLPGAVAADCLQVGGHTYLVTDFQQTLRGNPNDCGIWLVGKDKVARPVAAIGGLYLMEESHGSWNPLKNPGIKDLFSKLTMEHLLIWSDLDLDGKAEASEITTWKCDDPYVQAVRFQPDMSFIARNITMPAPRILANGVPVWSADQKPVVVTGKLLPENAVQVGKDGIVAFREGGGLIGMRDGQVTWEYPSENGDKIPFHPGMIIQAARFLGRPFRADKGEAGMVVGINGEKGSMYLMTGDGLFLQDVGGDNRIAPHMGSKYPSPKRGMVVEGVSFHDEHFGPSLSQTAEGDVVLIAGKEYSAIFRVDGLASVKRRTFATIDIPAARLAGMAPTMMVVPRKQERLSLAVALGGSAPQVDGRLDPKEWPSDQATQATLDGRASATLRIVGDRLYAAWRTGDAAALANATGDPKLLFKRGGAVDLMIASDPKADANRREPAAGDLRLIASLQDGKPMAVLFRAVVPNTAAGDRVPFISPVGRVDFDRVEVVSDKIQLAQREGDIELSIPLAVLGLQSLKEGTALLGDIGILRGTGAMTTQRLYWNNLDTSICSDVPSEARLMPANWGKWNIVPLAKTVGPR